MGRLENFIPKIKAFTVEGSKGVSVLHFPEEDPILVDSDIVPFLKQINGHMTFQEIILHLNEKRVFYSIEKAMDMVQHLANMNLMTNSGDFVQVLHSKAPGITHQPPKETLNHHYFSEERLIGLIQKTTLFLKCDRGTAELLLKESTLIEAPKGHRLIEDTTRSSDFYVLLSGQVGVFKNNECLAQLGPLSVFGESAAVFSKRRNADVITYETSWLLRIDASRLIDTQAPETFEAFKGLKSRLILNQTLSANPLLRGLPTDVMQFFISKCRIEKYSKEQTVIEQNEVSGDFYFILQGSVSVVRDGLPVTSLVEGNHFGEVAALFDQPRTASIITETDCTFLVLNQRAFFEVLSSHIRLAIDIERTALDRKNSTTNILQIFDEDEMDYEEVTAPVSLSDLSNSQITIDQGFIEVSQTNFNLELIDFSVDSDDEAS